MGELPYGWMLAILILLLALGANEWRRRASEKELSRTLQLFKVSQEINSTIYKQDLLQKIMDTASQVTDADASSVILVDSEKGDLFFELALGEKGGEIREIRLAMGEGIAGWVAQSGESIKIDNAASDSRWSSKVANRVDYPTRNLMCVPMTNKGEIIGVLQVLNKRNGKHFSDKDLKLLQSIASPTAISLENAMLYEALEKSVQALKDTVAAKERMESELRIASDIQLGFLPQRVTSLRSSPSMLDAGLVNESVDASTEMLMADSVRSMIRPAREVGGDFYDYFMVGESKLFFTLGDVSDKGIPAALFMAVTMTLIKGMMKADMTPGQLLTEVNRELYKDESAMFATIFCGVLDMVTGELTYSDGGHCTPYIIRDGGGVDPLIGIKGLPLGVLEDMEYSDNVAYLSRGERILLYTDGISEAEDVFLRQYGMTRLRELVGLEHQLTMDELMKRILQDVDLFIAGAKQSDDIAMLLVKCLSKESTIE
ncbi:Serine phosphatase RsbU, regulator of sigma subunit [Paenibacillus sp. 1_12]|uniref:GAF domain-containing SpoIIE family protein phosphatase n=1 Tax=Paenibacillus sp. 1_12 TaxID=1566278 RepID=UPI0008E09388|nr:GAF domain-containing SpoIIE family protein phosphatase [Paenibacillus sp. 1_12]SFM02291.1 Serine phosphatase RsbU, regulator of sigma subunit [Paenibacillus sp. 1_12]